MFNCKSCALAKTPPKESLLNLLDVHLGTPMSKEFPKYHFNNIGFLLSLGTITQLRYEKYT